MGLNVLSAIHGMSAIWDVRYWKVSLYKAFLRSHLDYCDVIYDKLCKEKLTDTVESIQYNAALAITGAIKGTSKEKLYNKLGLRIP